MSLPPEFRPVTYKWARHPDGEKLDEIGITDLGELINPRGYAPERVRETLIAAERRRKERASAAAAKAAKTRARRAALKVDKIAEAIVGGCVFGPRVACAICGRALSDEPSIERGIGSECWTSVLQTIERVAAGASE